MSEWISVDDRQPAHKQFVLVSDGNVTFAAVTNVNNQHHLFPTSYCGSYLDHVGEITHWQPLPDPPNGE